MRPVTRSQKKVKSEILDFDPLLKIDQINLIDFDSPNNPSSSSESDRDFQSSIMSQLSLETVIKLIPQFNGQNDDDIYPFLNACEFAVSCVQETIKPILVQAIRTKLSGKAFSVTQNREITDWAGLKTLLESAFCAKRTPGYLQLELNSTRQKTTESVQEYSGRIEKLFHELCNVSVTGRKPGEAEAIRSYIKETTLTSYVEGLHQNLRQIVKSKHLSSLEEAIKESLEEEKLLESNKEARRLFQYSNKPGNTSRKKYCNICHRNNHDTIQCRFSKDFKQKQESDQKISNLQQTKSVQKISCSYYKAKEHIRDDCFKKKKAEARQNGHQPGSSGNGAGPSTSGERSVKDINQFAQL
jgi:hypothetical protein